MQTSSLLVVFLLLTSSRTIRCCKSCKVRPLKHLRHPWHCQNLTDINSNKSTYGRNLFYSSTWNFAAPNIWIHSKLSKYTFVHKYQKITGWKREWSFKCIWRGAHVRDIEDYGKRSHKSKVKYNFSRHERIANMIWIFNLLRLVQVRF